MKMYALACVHLYMWMDRHVDGKTDMRTDGQPHIQELVLTDPDTN